MFFGLSVNSLMVGTVSFILLFPAPTTVPGWEEHSKNAGRGRNVADGLGRLCRTLSTRACHSPGPPTIGNLIISLGYVQPRHALGTKAARELTVSQFISFQFQGLLLLPGRDFWHLCMPSFATSRTYGLRSTFPVSWSFQMQRPHLSHLLVLMPHLNLVVTSSPSLALLHTLTSSWQGHWADLPIGSRCGPMPSRALLPRWLLFFLLFFPSIFLGLAIYGTFESTISQHFHDPSLEKAYNHETVLISYELAQTQN